MDWRAIDRLILLGWLVMLAPTIFGFALLLSLMLAPSYLHGQVANALLIFYAAHFLLLGGCLLVAHRRRRSIESFPLLENLLISSFVLNTMVTGYVTGTHLSNGLLLLFLGVNIASALSSVNKVRLGYLVSCVTIALIVIFSDFLGIWPRAPIFDTDLLRDTYAHLPAWIAMQAVLALILLILLGVCIAAVRRWVERETLYREMSMIDGLTRLTNRRCLIERGEKEMQRAQRMSEGSHPGFACVMLDLDHFKSINDTWGHQAGDEVLVTTSQVMMDNARQYDEVGRFGGEEFVVLLPNIAREDALRVAERIRASIENAKIEVEGRTIPVTASLGVAYYPSPGMTHLNDLLKAADEALYRAKESGRNRVCEADVEE